MLYELQRKVEWCQRIALAEKLETGDLTWRSARNRILKNNLASPEFPAERLAACVVSASNFLFDKVIPFDE